MQNDNTNSGTIEGWWMAPGPAICPCCEQPHHIEAMLYCSECDLLVCSVCLIVDVNSEPCCPNCHKKSGDL